MIGAGDFQWSFLSEVEHPPTLVTVGRALIDFTTQHSSITRSIYEASRDVARKLRGTADYEFMRHERKKVEMSFAHLKRILKLDRLRLRGPCGANDEFLLAATAQNLRKMAKLHMNGHKMSTA